jgi:toxin ParE1/3/4
MVIVRSDTAIQDLGGIGKYIERDNPSAAAATLRRIRDAVQALLVDQPGIGRPGRVDRTRELLVDRTPYIIPYRVAGERIEIIRVYHAARQWPDRFD